MWVKVEDRWAEVRGSDGRYMVSNIGRVKSFARNKAGRIMTPFTSHKGYLYVELFIGGKSRKEAIHRLVAAAFIENPENKPQVNHISGNKLDNAHINLEWATQSENQAHACKIGLVTHLKNKRCKVKKAA